jgi:hypothetical protein
MGAVATEAIEGLAGETEGVEGELGLAGADK